MQRWEPGTQVTWRYGDDSAEVVTVVQDDEKALVVRLPAGDGAGTTYEALRVAPVNAWWSVGVLVDADTQEHAGWRLSIEDPLTRGEHEVRTRDHVLDLEVAPDRTHHRVRADELALAVQQGRYNRDEAELITTVAEQAEALVEAWGSPFCDGWESREQPGRLREQ
jgi:uncharacterized protein